MQILFLLPVLLISVSIHEFLHGWVAFLFGDDTARKAGRLTLNPLAHVDVMGMIVVPLILMLTVGIPFGWAKPVPVNSMMMRNPKRNMIWVALAGPVSNVVLGAIGITLLKAGVFASIPAVKIMLFYLVYLNFALATLNLFPIPPLDGSRVLSGLLPRN